MSKSSPKIDSVAVQRRTEQLEWAGMKATAFLLNDPDAQDICDRIRAIRARYSCYAEDMPSRENRRRLAMWEGKLDALKTRLKALAEPETTVVE